VLASLSPLSQRILVAILLIPIGITLIWVGGAPFALFVALVLGLAALEFARLFQRGGFHPAVWILVGGSAVLPLIRLGGGDAFALPALTALIFLTMGWQVFTYRAAHETAVIDLNITLGGLVYMGGLGGYLVSLRQLPDGVWWFLLVFPAIWFADAGAYFVGSRMGKHRMAPHISPSKTWEGYLGGGVSSIALTAGLAALWALRVPYLTAGHGALLGAVIAILSPLGDLGESLIKRGFGVKDSSHLLPGHGGVFDRIDSWLWAAPLGYYMIVWFF
jgi:phosphatidate cytidylyltransferase